MGTQIVPAKMPSLDAIFCRGNKSNPCSLVRFHAAVNIKNPPLALRAREKFWARLVGKSTQFALEPHDSESHHAVRYNTEPYSLTATD